MTNSMTNHQRFENLRNTLKVNKHRDNDKVKKSSIHYFDVERRNDSDGVDEKKCKKL